VRTAGDPLTMAATVRAEIQRLDQNLPVFDVKTLGEHIGEAVAQEKMIATLLAIFGLLALLLASVGIYGVISYWVAQRTREIGVRIALGAAPRNIINLIVGRGFVLIAIGLAIGLAAALALTRLTASLLYETSATDPLTFIVVPLILTGVALGACFVPARRATKVDPMVALRYE
jgi:ABC-type antimicrobial peptide transport system permease subunit